MKVCCHGEEKHKPVPNVSGGKLPRPRKKESPTGHPAPSLQEATQREKKNVWPKRMGGKEKKNRPSNFHQEKKRGKRGGSGAEIEEQIRTPKRGLLEKREEPLAELQRKVPLGHKKKLRREEERPRPLRGGVWCDGKRRYESQIKKKKADENAGRTPLLLWPKNHPAGGGLASRRKVAASGGGASVVPQQGFSKRPGRWDAA